jgi:hypothetical protein
MVAGETNQIGTASGRGRSTKQSLNGKSYLLLRHQRNDGAMLTSSPSQAPPMSFFQHPAWRAA